MEDHDQDYVIYNSLPWERREWIMDEQGQPRYVRSRGWGALLTEIPQPQDARLTETAEGYLLENQYLEIVVDASGALIRLTDKKAGDRCYARGSG